MNERIRTCFPALERKSGDEPFIYLDGPGGVQVPEAVITAISQYYEWHNANSHGHFPTSRETDAIITKAREDAARFLNAQSPECISFGQNMTTLTYALSHGIRRLLSPGDEVVITQLDHEANRGPWTSLKETGIFIREVRLLPSGHLDYDDLKEKINERTKVVAMGYASNIFGTVNNIQLASQLCKKAGAWLVIDGVHFAPHFRIDVKTLDCDFFLCSAYKFYGPHVGILYSRPGLLDEIPTDRLITQDQKAPYRIETGTLNHAALAGVSAAIEFLQNIDTGHKSLDAAYKMIWRHEKKLGQQLYEGLKRIDSVTVMGPDYSARRTPTLAFTSDKLRPDEICRKLGEQGICAWDGHFYAIRASEVMGLQERGGVVRLGISLYNTGKEMDRTLETIRRILAS